MMYNLVFIFQGYKQTWTVQKLAENSFLTMLGNRVTVADNGDVKNHVGAVVGSVIKIERV